MMQSAKYSTSLSKKEEQLVRQLLSIWRDKEFVLGVICTLKNDNEVQQMIDYVNSNEEISPHGITLKALYISKGIDEEELVTDDFFRDLRLLSQSV